MGDPSGWLAGWLYAMNCSFVDLDFSVINYWVKMAGWYSGLGSKSALAEERYGVNITSITSHCLFDFLSSV